MNKNLIASACKFNTLVFIFVLIIFTSHAQEIPTEPAAVKAGETLFVANCKACHAVDRKLVGPALAGIEGRAPSIQWIIDFVHNSSRVISSGDEYAVKLYNEYNKTQMTAFTSLKDEDVLNILAYVKAEAEKEPEVAPVPPGGQVASADGVSSEYLNIILIGLVIILLLLLIILGLLVSALKRFLDEKELSEEDKEIVHSPISIGSVTSSPGFIFLVVFLVGALGFKAVINSLFSIGVQQGYAPKQPIAFSHKIHAGQYEIDCNYCHVGAAKGRMQLSPQSHLYDCHNQIRTGTLTARERSRKLCQHTKTTNLLSGCVFTTFLISHISITHST